MVSASADEVLYSPKFAGAREFCQLAGLVLAEGALHSGLLPDYAKHEIQPRVRRMLSCAPHLADDLRARYPDYFNYTDQFEFERTALKAMQLGPSLFPTTFQADLNAIADKLRLATDLPVDRHVAVFMRAAGAAPSLDFFFEFDYERMERRINALTWVDALRYSRKYRHFFDEFYHFRFPPDVINAAFDPLKTFPDAAKAFETEAKQGAFSEITNIVIALCGGEPNRNFFLYSHDYIYRRVEHLTVFNSWKLPIEYRHHGAFAFPRSDIRVSYGAPLPPPPELPELSTPGVFAPIVNEMLLRCKGDPKDPLFFVKNEFADKELALTKGNFPTDRGTLQSHFPAAALNLSWQKFLSEAGLDKH